MNDITNDITNAVLMIKRAILVSQSRAIRMISGEQLSLYFGIGCYVSEHSRKGYWGTSAIRTISEQLRREMPGLRGFSEESIKSMRQFAEFWKPFFCKPTEDGVSGINQNRLPVATELETPSILPTKTSGIQIDIFAMQNWSPIATEINRQDFLEVSFTHHIEILHKTKDIHQVLFYLHQTVIHSWTKIQLREALKADIYKNGYNTMPNNFISTMPSTRDALKAISMFKDEYLLDFINVEDIREEYKDVDERVVEKEIIREIKSFIMTFGNDFAFIGNQYYLEAYGEEQFPDLLFFNRTLNSLVVIELKIGKFKSAYLGQLAGYMQILDDKVRKAHENPTIGIVLCKEANQTYAEYAIRDYSKPMGVATYRTLDDMPEEIRHALPSNEDLKRIFEKQEIVDNI